MTAVGEYWMHPASLGSACPSRAAPRPDRAGIETCENGRIFLVRGLCALSKHGETGPARLLRRRFESPQDDDGLAPNRHDIVGIEPAVALIPRGARRGAV